MTGGGNTRAPLAAVCGHADKECTTVARRWRGALWTAVTRWFHNVPHNSNGCMARAGTPYSLCAAVLAGRVAWCFVLAWPVLDRLSSSCIVHGLQDGGRLDVPPPGADVHARQLSKSMRALHSYSYGGMITANLFMKQTTFVRTNLTLEP